MPVVQKRKTRIEVEKTDVSVYHRALISFILIKILIKYSVVLNNT